jgi:hypothetical protein
MIPNPEKPTPTPPDENLSRRLSNFRPRRTVIPSNDPALEAFLSGAVDFTRPDESEGGPSWT